jgi:hypothetical protein
MRRQQLPIITVLALGASLLLTGEAMGQLKERSRDAKTNRNVERWIKKIAAIDDDVEMHRVVLGDIPVSGVSAMYSGSFEKRGANWELIRYSRDGKADLLELQKDGERVGARVTCDENDITEENVKKVLKKMDD